MTVACDHCKSSQKLAFKEGNKPRLRLYKDK